MPNRYQLIVEDEQGNVSEETTIGETLWEAPLSEDDKEKLVKHFIQIIFKQERRRVNKITGKRRMGEIAI